MDTGTVLAVTKTPSLYFCPVCGKPCTQETSFTRHVQYCKRRAATKRTSRPRACRHCRTTKSKCDAQWPCSRCTSRQKECVYDKPWPTAGAAGESATVAVAESARVAEEGSQESAAGTDAGAPNASSSTSSSTSDTAAGYSSNSPATSDETSLNGPSGDNACPESCCPGLSATLPFTSAGSGTSTVALAVATPTTLSTTVASTAPMVLDPPSFDGSGISSVPNFLLSQSSGLYGLGGFSHYGNPGMGSASIGLATAQPSSLSTVHMPSPFLLHLPYAPPPDPIVEFSGGRAGPSPSAELRRLIVSMVRTFPRMMTQPGSMPPFIHRIGCGLHYEDVAAEATIPQAAAAIPLASSSSSSSSLSFPLPGGAATDTSMSMSASSYQTALFTPLPIMAACVGISHAFVTRSAHSDEFLWRAIDKEHQNIMQRMESLSLGEIFVALQAVAIYTTMRLIVYGREYFFSDASLLDTMSRLSGRFHDVWKSPFMPAHDEDHKLVRSSRPQWEDWIFDETRRRITMTCWLMTLAVNPRAEPYDLMNPHRFQLPSSRRLWEAETRAVWEREYESDQFEKHILAQCATHGSTKNKVTKLTTVGDLAMAIDRSVAAEGSLDRPSNDALYEDDLLAYWHAGVDSLGMMVTAAAAQYTSD